MIIFVNYGLGIKAIPMERIFSITQTQNVIDIFYDEGVLLEMEGTFQKKVECITIHYNSESLAIQEMYLFYKANKNGENSYNFCDDLKKLE